MDYISEMQQQAFDVASSQIDALCDRPDLLAKLGKRLGEVAPPDSLPVRLQPRKPKNSR